MSRLPTRIDAASYQADKAERERSPLYWLHPICTVYEYRHLDRAGQDRVNAECRRIEQAKKNSQ